MYMIIASRVENNDFLRLSKMIKGKESHNHINRDYCNNYGIITNLSLLFEFIS